MVSHRKLFVTTTTTTATPLDKRPRKVSFDSVHVHEHSVVLGDNPSVSSGLPVALGERCQTETMDVDDYEAFERSGRQARLLTKEQRAKIGRASRNLVTVLRTKREIKRIQKSREESYRESTDVSRISTSSSRRALSLPSSPQVIHEAVKTWEEQVRFGQHSF